MTSQIRFKRLAKSRNLKIIIVFIHRLAIQQEQPMLLGLQVVSITFPSTIPTCSVGHWENSNWIFLLNLNKFAVECNAKTLLSKKTNSRKSLWPLLAQTAHPTAKIFKSRLNRSLTNHGPLSKPLNQNRTFLADCRPANPQQLHKNEASLCPLNSYLY